MEKWASKTETLGSWLSLPDSHAAETVARVDFDYVCVDMQHGIADYQVAAVMLQASSKLRLSKMTTPAGGYSTFDLPTAARAVSCGARVCVHAYPYACVCP